MRCWEQIWYIVLNERVAVERIVHLSDHVTHPSSTAQLQLNGGITIFNVEMCGLGPREIFGGNPTYTEPVYLSKFGLFVWYSQHESNPVR